LSIIKVSGRKEFSQFGDFSLKKSAISKKVSLCEEWYGKFGSQKLFLMFKSPVMMRMLFILTLVFLGYFKAN